MIENDSKLSRIWDNPEGTIYRYTNVVRLYTSPEDEWNDGYHRYMFYGNIGMDVMPEGFVSLYAHPNIGYTAEIYLTSPVAMRHNTVANHMVQRILSGIVTAKIPKRIRKYQDAYWSTMASNETAWGAYLHNLECVQSARERGIPIAAGLYGQEFKDGSHNGNFQNILAHMIGVETSFVLEILQKELESGRIRTYKIDK